MNTHIRVTGISMTEAIEDYVTRKVAAFDKYVSKDSSADLSVELQKTTAHHKAGDIFKAELDLRFGGSHFHVASEESDLYAAIDKAKDELLQELRSQKGKREALWRRGHRKIKDMLRGFSRGNTV